MSSQYPPGFVHHLRTLIRQRTDALEAIVDIASPTLLDEPSRCSVRLARCAELARQGLEPNVEDDDG